MTLNEERPDSVLRQTETVRQKRTGLYPNIRDRQKRPDSCLSTRPSEETGLVPTLWDRQKRPDSIPNYETVRGDRTRPYTVRDRCNDNGPRRLVFNVEYYLVARQPLSLRDLQFCSLSFVERPLYTHWQCPECNAHQRSQASQPTINYPIKPRVQAGHDLYR